MEVECGRMVFSGGGAGEGVARAAGRVDRRRKRDRRRRWRRGGGIKRKDGFGSFI